MIEKLKTKWRSLSRPAQASLAIACCRFFEMGISVLLTPVFTRLMQTEEYGNFTVIFSWLEIIAVFSTMNLAGSPFQQALVKYDKRKGELAASVAGLGTLSSICVFIVYLLLRKWLTPVLRFDAVIFACIIILSWSCLMFDIWVALQNNEYKYKVKICITLFVSIAEPILGIAAIRLIPSHMGHARFYSVVLIKTLVYGGFFVYFLNRGNFYNRELWRYFIGLSLPLIPHYLTGIVLNQSDRVMIKNLVGSSEAGIYGLGHSIAWMLCMVTGAVIYSLKPWIFKRLKENDQQRIGKTVYGMLILVALAGLGLISVAPEALYIFAPKEFHSASFVIAPLTASIYFMFMYELFCCFEFYYEKTKIITSVSLFAGVLNILLNYFLIRSFGWIAAGFTTLFCHMLLALIHYIISERITHKKISKKTFSVPVLLSISASFIILSVLMMTLYEHVLIRYAIILICLIVLILKRKLIKDSFNLPSP